MKYDDWSDWTDWVLLSSVDINSIPKGPGVYIIASEKELSRAVGVDEHGILDIGESERLNLRVRAFISCATGTRQKGHMAGWRYRNFNFEDVFPIDTLYVCWKSCNTKEDAYTLEGKLLNEYVRQHYELPPLNYKFNWSE
ncbi:hypothetical protein NB466_15340 [Vibrio fluvialis]|uniref:hypothetical protein n=1 Tax=Vibrio fluvialis TaxID=676 RepID=UPI00215D4EF4|nr:hypothetical protein [Vibrio fluvialis]MCR9300237.1 hypothetical protein [Vibrio fluvialis]